VRLVRPWPSPPAVAVPGVARLVAAVPAAARRAAAAVAAVAGPSDRPGMTRTRSETDPVAVRAFAVEAARLVSDLKCDQVVLMDVRGRSQVCEYIVVANGTSDRQMRSVADELKDLGGQMGMRRWRGDRDSGGTWVVADFVDVVVHLFEPGQRAWYDLDGLWADAPRVTWKRPAGEKPRTRVRAADAED
jgi:ribosome-associated protein